MNILVTGANGQLGREMRIVSHKAGMDKHHWIFADIAEAEGLDTLILDITNLEAVRHTVVNNQIACIVNCAAYTNVERAEEDEERCRLLNATAPKLLADVMKECHGLLIHISTDYVFGADAYNTPCNETQQGTPTGIYGLTKLEGEQAILATGCRSIIIRTAWLYSEFGNNFVKTMLRLTAEKPQLQVVFDQTGTPTYALDLAHAVCAAIQKPVEGIYHFSNEGVCSWYDFTMAIAEMAGHSHCRILPCHSNEFPSKVKRPAYSVLDKTKIKETFNIEVPYWRESLSKCIQQLKY